jgi:hypothetical protein
MSYSNYPEGSMRGSGIYAEDWSGIFYCSDCDDEYELDGQTDDWGYQAFAECPDCQKQLEIDLPTREEMRDDYYADYREGK